MLALILFLATTMAIFGTLGYLKGTRWALIAFLILFAAFFVVEKMPDFIISTLNGLYMGFMLVLHGGLGDIASGDLDAAAETLESIQAPFEGDTEKYALILVIVGAIALGLLFFVLFKKSKSSAMGLIIGLAYGYLAVAALLPLIADTSGSNLPVPIIRPPERNVGGGAVAAQVSSTLDKLWTRLAEPQTIQVLSIAIGLSIVLFLFFTVRKSLKSPKKG